MAELRKIAIFFGKHFNEHPVSQGDNILILSETLAWNNKCFPRVVREGELIFTLNLLLLITFGNNIIIIYIAKQYPIFFSS